MKPDKKTNTTDPMEEAYKQLDGDPAKDAVSKAAKGEQPQTDDEQRMDEAPADPTQCSEIEEAYARLFESLAIIMRK